MTVSSAGGDVTETKMQRRRRHGVGAPHPIDLHVGSRMRLRRNMLRMSQETLADALGVTFQQVQKYERAANRISASRLMEIARVLGVPVSFFYDDVDPVHAPPVGSGEDGIDVLEQEETKDLVAAYYTVGDPAVRKRLLDLSKALATVGIERSSRVELEFEALTKRVPVTVTGRRGRPART